MQPEYQRIDVYSWVQCGLSLIITPVSVENWFISRSYNIKIGLFPEATTSKLVYFQKLQHQNWFISRSYNDFLG